MGNLMNRIIKTIEEKAFKHGIMGTESVNVTLILTEDEVKEFDKLELDEHYKWELEGSELFISYQEEI